MRVSRRTELPRQRREDRANRWVFAAFAVIGFASAYLPASTDRIGFGPSTPTVFVGLESLRYRQTAPKAARPFLVSCGERGSSTGGSLRRQDELRLDQPHIVGHTRCAPGPPMWACSSASIRAAPWCGSLPPGLDGREVIAVYEDPQAVKPSYLMWLEWRDGRISFIRDYKYVRYVIDDARRLNSAT
jgi:hypothetical protein